MNYLLYSPTKKKFFKEFGQGLTKDIKEMKIWSKAEFKEREIPELLINKNIYIDRILAIPMSTENIQNETRGFLFNIKRRDFWKSPKEGITKNIKKAHIYTFKEFKSARTDSYLGANSFFVPLEFSEEEIIEEPIKKEVFRSSKVFDGFSTVFRQHKAQGTHCRFLHGYGISFKVYFEGELDERNWVWDFGGMKRAKTLIDGLQPKAWMDYMFDHTVILAEDDPMLDVFNNLAIAGVIQLRVIEATGAEKFAEYIYNKLNAFVKEETNNRVRVTEVEFSEHGKNAATYGE